MSTSNKVRGTKPEVGMGATIVLWSDQHAATVVEVVSDRKIVVQRDTAIRTDNNGMSESQEYRYQPNPESERLTFTLREEGGWVQENHRVKGGVSLTLGRRDEHYDYSF